MRIVDALLSVGAAMIALLVYLDIYMNQVLSGHLFLSIVMARHWTLQYMINIAGSMAVLSQLSYKETAKQAFYCYIAFLVSAIAITDFPILDDGACQFITMINIAIYARSLVHEGNGFRQALLEIHAERIGRLQ